MSRREAGPLGLSSGRRHTLPIPCLCLVTNRHLCGGRPLEEMVAQAVAGGVDLVQLREKDLSGGPLLELAQRLRAITRGKALFLVNERVDVALACGADGVHLGEAGLPVGVVRKLVGEDPLIGRSVHSLEGALVAAEQGADFLHLGAIFATDSKPEATPVGPALMREVVKAVEIPVLGIGGIQAANLCQVVEAGGHGVAVIGSIMKYARPEEAALSLRRALQEAWQRRPERVTS